MLSLLYPLLLVISSAINPTYHRPIKIAEYLDGLPESITVSMKANAISDRWMFASNEDRQVAAASIIKVPILITLFQEFEAGHIRLDEEYILRKSDKVGGAGELQHKPPGLTFTISEIAERMILDSDNTATNILINKIGMGRVNQFLQENSLRKTSLQRLMMDFDAIEEGRQNYTSASDMNRLYQLLWDLKLLTEESTVVVSDILLRCKDDTAIPARLPSSARVAHKTGTLEYVRGDSGIIIGDNGKIILSVFVEGFEDIDQANEIISTIARLVYDSAQ